MSHHLIGRIGQRLKRYIPVNRRELETYRHAFETTAADRDRLGEELARSREELAGCGEELARSQEELARSREELAGCGEELARSQEELAGCRQELERVAASNGALLQERETYKHAFETTAADRDRLAGRLDGLTADFWATADPADAGYFRLNFVRYQHPKYIEEGLPLVDDWVKKFVEGDYLAVVQAVLSAIPVMMALRGADEEIKAIAAYYISSMMAARGSFGEAAHYSQFVHHSAPIDGTDFLPYDLKQGARLASWRQELAISRGRPGIVITSLQRSASAFLSNTIAELLDVPLMRTSVGEGFRSVVVDRWARQIGRGGAVTHEHYPASASSLDALSRSGIARLWVQIRDPRDSAYSWFSQEGRFAESSSATVREFVDFCVLLSEWISGWIAAAEDPDHRPRIEFVTYDQVTRDLPSTLKRMLGSHYDDAFDAKVRKYIERFAQGEAIPLNFRTGKGQEWRDVIAHDVQNEIYEKMSNSTKRFMKLAP